MINYGRHYIDTQDINAVVKVLKSNFLTQGPTVKEFEKNLKKKFKCKYCTTVNNATTALYLIGKVLNWNSTTKVACPAMSFVASSNCILFHSSKPIFIDINQKDYCIDVKLLEKEIKKDRSIKYAIITDYAGQPADWVSLRHLANKYKITLINDNCHSIGSKIENDIGYACKYADFVVHSYHPVKTITTGEGGAIFTNSKKNYEKIVLLKNHYQKKDLTNWNTEVSGLGYNSRMSDINAALGIQQLKKLEKFVKKRRLIANFYNKMLCGIDGIILPEEKQNFYHSYHLYAIQINFDKFKISKVDFLNKLKKKKINLQIHYKPAYKFKLYKKYNLFNYPNSDLFYKRTISLPVYYSLSKNKLKIIIKNIQNVLKIR